jgi:hypothetical protein
MGESRYYTGWLIGNWHQLARTPAAGKVNGFKLRYSHTIQKLKFIDIIEIKKYKSKTFYCTWVVISSQEKRTVLVLVAE